MVKTLLPTPINNKTNNKCSADEKIPPPSVPMAVEYPAVFHHHVSNASHLVLAAVYPVVSKMTVPVALVLIDQCTRPTNFSNRGSNF